VNEARFATQAGRLAGRVSLLLGWRPDEFWAATPAELAAIFAARDEAAPATSIGRDELTRLMEQDSHG
jgi:hypothetical protein